MMKLRIDWLAKIIMTIMAYFVFHSVLGGESPSAMGDRLLVRTLIQEGIERLSGQNQLAIDKCLQQLEHQYEEREKRIDALTDAEIRFFTNKINFLGWLLSLAGIVAIVVPLYAGLKIHRSWRKAVEAQSNAQCAIDSLAAARKANLRTKGMHNFVNSKNCYRQYEALSNRFTVRKGEKHEKDTVGALFVGIEELRLNFLAQAVVSLERAIAYNAEAGCDKAIRANLTVLALYDEVISMRKEDCAWLKRRLHSLRWTAAPLVINGAIAKIEIDDTRKRKMIMAYERFSAEFGHLVFC